MRRIQAVPAQITAQLKVPGCSQPGNAPENVVINACPSLQPIEGKIRTLFVLVVIAGITLNALIPSPNGHGSPSCRIFIAHAVSKNKCLRKPQRVGW